eukprot:TRINITY_DN16614_c0_g1_i1.p1 TRINITY_DN16614_c0_g1~~TRINITY_DN16614_c0_g1_i1.p1  ORF type:complete len:120 (+),score=25.32 TRINITY_DN16614_c0_g1_i1:261-620(+)
MGILDFAKLDAEHDCDMHLQISGKWINCATIQNPVCVIANYLFDTLRQEAFRVVDGKLQVALSSVYIPLDQADPDEITSLEADILDPDLIERAHYAWDYVPVDDKDIPTFLLGVTPMQT